MQLNQLKLYVVTFQHSGWHLNLGWKVFTTKREAEQAMRREQEEFTTTGLCQPGEGDFRVIKLPEAISKAQVIAQEIGKRGRSKRGTRK